MAEGVRDAQGRPVKMAGAIQDVTERRQLEERLRQSQKMEAIGQLAAGVAHDFNNILAVISGHAGLLKNQILAGRAGTESADKINKAVERAAGLIRQLLMFSRKQVIQPKILDLNAVLRNLANLLLRLLGEDINLEFNYAPSLPQIEADTGMLEQVVMNLAVNSRDAMPK